MAVQSPARPTTAPRAASRSSNALHLSLTGRGVRPTASTAARPAQDIVNPAKLQEVEDRLLADAIEQHAHVEAALDGALDEMNGLSDELRHSRCGPLLLRSTTNLNRVEDLLLEAILSAHPNREDALDRLLADVSDDEIAAARDRARAEFDMAIDNDFDGMA